MNEPSSTTPTNSTLPVTSASSTPEAVTTSPTIPAAIAPLSAAPQNAPSSATAPEPPRALTPGAFLQGEIEVKSVLSRGTVNIYEAARGDYGAAVPILLAEREIASVAAISVQAVAQPVTTAAETHALAPAAVLSEKTTPQTQAVVQDAEPPSVEWENVESSTLTESDDSTKEAEEAANATRFSTSSSVDESAASGAFVEDVDTLPVNETLTYTSSSPTDTLQDTTQAATLASATPTVATATNEETVSAAVLVGPNHSASAASEAASSAPTVAESALQSSDDASVAGESSTAELQSSLFIVSESFTQEDREYRIFPHFISTTLQDWREPANDERLLQMLHDFAEGLVELKQKQQRAAFSLETLRVDNESRLRFLGFTEAGDFNALEELRRVANFLFKQTFAEAVTMRLDDEYSSLVLSEELKSVARRLNPDSSQAFTSIHEAATAIDSLHSSTRLRADFALLTDVGRERELNEDSGLIVTTNRQAHLGMREWELYVVADGMGGHEGGEVASDLTLSSLVRNLESHDIDWNDNVAVKAALIQTIDTVNAEVVALTETPRYKGTRAKPGSTLVFSLRVGARVFVGNVGDSRAYKYADGVLERISKDHSYVQTLIDSGDITEDEAFVHPDGSVITAHIGYPKLKQRDVFLRLFRRGEMLLLVSDGVTDMLRDAEYHPHLQHEDPADVCRALVDASNEAGGADNITVVCVKFR